MERIPISHHLATLIGFPCRIPMPSGINLAFARLSRSDWQVGYVLLTRAPVAIRIPLPEPYAAPRLACVKPVASVHPEPGSNSSLYISISFVPYARNRSYLLIDVGFIPSKRPLYQDRSALVLLVCSSSFQASRLLFRRLSLSKADAKVERLRVPSKLFRHIFSRNF